MRAWTQMTNDELVLHLDLWLEMDGRVEDKSQVDFFREVIFRLQLMEGRNDDSIR